MSNDHDTNTSAAPPAPCSDYCCSAFSLFESEVITWLPDLSIPIHPLFAQSNFSSDFDYAMLEPSLRLATRLLQSNSLAPYLAAMYDGVVQDLDNGTMLDSVTVMATNCEKRYAIWPRPGQEEYNRPTKSRCKRILKHLAGMVEFQLATISNGSIVAQTQMLGTELPLSSIKFFPRGLKSKITVNKSIYDALVHHTTRIQSPAPIGRAWNMSIVLHYRFQFAQFLCHEIGHALQNATFGHHGRPTEVFYKDHQLAEGGYELEFQLFNGLMVEFGGDSLGNSQTFRNACEAGRKRQPSRVFYLQEWPSWSKMSYYQHRLNQPICSGEMHAKFDIFWTVSNSFMLSLLTDAFWIKSEQSHSMDSLHPPKLASWPFSNNKVGDELSPMTFQEVQNRFGH